MAPLVGYAVAVLLHASWNGSAFLHDGDYFLLTYLFAMVPGFLVLVGLAIWFRVREGAMLTCLAVVPAVLALAVNGIGLPVLWIVALALVVIGVVYLIGAGRRAASRGGTME